MIKTSWRRAELHGVYMKNTKDAHIYSVKHMSGTLGNKRKKQRHTLYERTFHYVELGDVKHSKKVECTDLSGIKSCFRFVFLGEAGQVSAGGRSCACRSCISMDNMPACRGNRSVLGDLKKVRLEQTSGSGVASGKAREAAVRELISRKVRQYKSSLVEDDCTVLEVAGSDFMLAKVARAPRQIQKGEEKIGSGQYAEAGTWVVDAVPFVCEKEWTSEADGQYSMEKGELCTAP